jgi:KAP-like P-loop domain-containing protein
MKKDPPEFTFLKDEPQKKFEASYEGFYHASVAPALKKILKDDSSPHTIGLFGAWGTGKSTVVEMVQNDADFDLPVFIFDAWKYQEDTLRRTFLIKLVDFLRDHKYSIGADILTHLYGSTTDSVTSNGEPSSKDDRQWYKRLLGNTRRFALLGTLAASIIMIVLLKTVWRHFSAAAFLDATLSFIASLSVLVVILKPAVDEIVKTAVRSLFSKQISQTELITKTIQQDRLNSPEQFEAKFIEILNCVDKKMVIVFDNIDRVQGDVAISMLSTIKTFMYSGTGKGLVFLVPCDPTAIEVQVEKYFYGTNHGQTDSFGAAEYLRKVFNLIIWIPDFINTDLDEYTKSLLKGTGEISKQLNNEDVRLVINAAFSRNPREIIQFINNLIAMVISTQGTAVKDIINGNIAYLAKVLIIRQKFPRAYESLKETWNNPEQIINSPDENPNSEFTKFMRKTSRITVDDAEPFIYFKDPVDSRGLSRAIDIKNSLLAANVTEAIEAATGEPQDKLIEFISDLVAKYSGQESVLTNVVNTQFEVVSGLNIEVDSKRYINEIAKTIDAELWPKYEEFSLPHIFGLLTNKKLNSSYRENIIARYIAVLSTEGSITPLQRGIISSFKENASVLTKQQMTEVRSVLESRYGTDEETLAIFDTKESQEALITEKLLDGYIASFDFDNLTTKLATIANFKNYVLQHGLVPDVVSAISELMKKDVAADSRYSANKAKIVEAVSPLTKIFGQEISNGSGYLSEIATSIVKVIPYTSQWEERSDQIIALFWLRNYVNSADKQSVINSINSYFQSFTDISQFQRPLDYWNEESTGRFIRLILPTILPRLATSTDVLRYIYEHAATEEKKTILNDLIDRVPADNYYDIEFIGTLNKLPDRKEIVSKLLEKAGRNTYTFKSKYFDFIAIKMLKSDAAELKLALEQVKALITSNDSSQADVGYAFLNQLQFMQDTDKRRLATDLLTWLREPGRSISSVNRIAFQVINNYYPLLQDTPKNDYIYLLFSLISEVQDVQMVQVITSALQVARPSYKTHSKDFDDLLSRMQGWSGTQAKQEIFNTLPSFGSSRQSKSEREYWDSFKALYPEEA